MPVVVIQALGVLVFLAGSLRLASRVGRTGDHTAAEHASRISHMLFWLGLVLPGTIGFFYPGLGAYDDLFGLPSLPGRFLWIAVGVVLLSVGAVLVVISNRSLVARGRGTAAFLLTKQLVTDGPYARTRNPMSLGFYSACLGVGMIADSLTITLAVLLIVVPVHAVNLKLFEEREMERRYGAAYLAYRLRVPFLIPRLGRT